MKYPKDIDRAIEEWNANCGPTALAAILDRTLADTRPLVNGFDQRGYMNIGHVLAALTNAKVSFKARLKRRPGYGLIFVQWGGHEDKPIRAQYRFTHWIAVDGNRVFDVNLPTLVHWNYWERALPAMMKEEGDGDGSYFIRSAIEVIR